jgi:DNA-binding response OmpR family regulator
MSKRVLVVEDDEALARLLCDNIAYDGCAVERAGDAAQALAKVQAFAPHLVLLDLMLPGADGFEVCRVLSQGPRRTPIIILTARNRMEDKVRGLELGADDYVTKPFALDELLARVHAVLRRTHPPVVRIRLGPILVDFGENRASRLGLALELTHLEFEILRCLALKQSSVVSREELLLSVWGFQEMPLTRTVDNAIARLRRKIEPDAHRPCYIRTAHGGGYALHWEPVEAAR